MGHLAEEMICPMGVVAASAHKITGNHHEVSRYIEVLAAGVLMHERDDPILNDFGEFGLISTHLCIGYGNKGGRGIAGGCRDAHE